LARFIGEYQHTIDQKSRLIIPARWRESISPERDGSGFYLTPGFDQCLFVYTPTAWEETQSIVDALDYTLEDEREFQRMFFARARYSEMDAQGRILIESGLLRDARLRKKVVLTGVSQRIEIWDADRWAAYALKGGQDFERAAQGLLKKPGGGN
jgi:MraZ protein